MARMSTQKLIMTLLNDGTPTDSAVDALRELLDDATVEVDAPMGVAEAAALTGPTTTTLRYYEAEGLVRPERDQSGYRLYGPADLRRLIFLTRMRLSGMGIRDLKRYIRLVDEGEQTAPERRAMMVEQRDRIASQLRELNLALAATEYKITTYGGAPHD